MRPTIATERLTLVPFHADEVTLLHQTFTDPFVRKYLWDDQVVSVEQTQEMLTTNEAYFQNHKWGLWKIILKGDNAYAGFVGLWYFFDEDQPQLVYGLLADKTKQGYATEAAKAIIEYAFLHLQFTYLSASCDSPHTDSKKVCERLKMKHVEEKLISGKPVTFYRINK
jgi:ribosomal-protein-alanine N-acetyltransferase